jgi:nitrile hydratase accessory protein
LNALKVATAPDAPVFKEPWEAQAFALAVALHARGAFTWAEWSETLAATLRRDAGQYSYYQCWLAALERVSAQKGMVEPIALSNRKEAWRRAAQATPHGAPILLQNDPSGHS